MYAQKSQGGGCQTFTACAWGCIKRGRHALAIFYVYKTHAGCCETCERHQGGCPNALKKTSGGSRRLQRRKKVFFDVLTSHCPREAFTQPLHNAHGLFNWVKKIACVAWALRVHTDNNQHNNANNTFVFGTPAMSTMRLFLYGPLDPHAAIP